MESYGPDPSSKFAILVFVCALVGIESETLLKVCRVRRWVSSADEVVDDC